MILAATSGETLLTSIIAIAGTLGAFGLAYVGYKRDLLGLQKATPAGRAKASASEARAAAADAQATALAFAPLVVDLQAKIASAERKAEEASQAARESRQAEERCARDLDSIRGEHKRLETMLEGVLSESAGRKRHTRS